MTWTSLLESRDVQRHRTSRREIDDIRALVARDLADARLVGLSADRRFATAYNAALQAANIAIAAAGYRVTSKIGHHRVAIEGIRLALGGPADEYADYFEACRRKRNTIDCTRSHVATDSEAAEIVDRAAEFCALVERWIAENHPRLQAQ
jgi:hypothetical protein